MLALLRIEGLGEVTLRRLIDEHGSAAAMVDSGKLKAHRGVPATVRDAIGRARPLPSHEVRLPPGVRLVTYGSPDYPHGLRRLVRPPPILYLRGPQRPPRDRTVAIVGTRRASRYGRRVAAEIAFDLAKAGCTVVSGVARGIDAAAHRGALDAGGPTVGVLGCGLDHVYPATSRDLYAALGERGLLVTEHELGTRPLSHHFPRRNRIIAALSQAVVVVQAGLPSGALITVDHALDLGLEVFAVPGPVDDPASLGVHQLLREGATLAADAGDILDVLGLGATGSSSDCDVANAAAPTPACPGRDDLAGRLTARLLDGAASLEDLVRDLGIPVPVLLAALVRLELAGSVTALPGQRFRLRDRA